jgi:hypothetical protein
MTGSNSRRHPNHQAIRTRRRRAEPPAPGGGHCTMTV